uniref:Uncharacterized protein n=1 Tax=Strombidium rassoulzadegani TaxID=1082188 RepID=A0A7S3CKG7_9SPIT|mmetsp:Transcript_13629/g.23205  ORF Transcript_13629/g.23205 Transcript_13629/m.23205 type:complete len:143 (+) Transcript_13629:414-842(+)
MQEKVVKNLVETSLDITYAYGMDKIPPLSAIPIFEVDFKKDYGFEDLSINTLQKKLKDFEDPSYFSTLKNFLTDKLGFSHSNAKSYEHGLETVEAWSLLNKDETSASPFICQFFQAKNDAKMEDCYKELTNKVRSFVASTLY